MSTAARLALGTCVLSSALLLAGCPGDFSGGYDKVPNRVRTPVAIAAAPDPPPVVAGIGGTATVEVPVLAAGAPAGITQDMVESGQRLYGTVCTACHGPGGVGTPAGPGLQDQDWIHIDGSYESIVAIIQSGVANPRQYPGIMPPLGGGNYSAEEVREIAAYLFALSQTGG